MLIFGVSFSYDLVLGCIGSFGVLRSLQMGQIGGAHLENKNVNWLYWLAAYWVIIKNWLDFGPMKYW